MKRAFIVINQATTTVVATTNIQKKGETLFEKNIKIKLPS